MIRMSRTDRIYADLHAHTTASDGELSPEELVDRAADAGVAALAVTDHDTMAGVERAVARGKERGVEIVPGCELTIYVCQIELHLLALFVDPAHGPFAKLLQELQAHRRERGLQMVRQLNAAGTPISDADVLEMAGGASAIGRPHVAAALVKRGHAPSHRVAFVKFLQEGKPGFAPKHRLEPSDVFAAIYASGGLSILAHPGVFPHDELIRPLFSQGMDGIEALYRSHSEMNRRFYAGLARRYEKLISGGSDFHGPRVRPGVNVGDGGVERAIYTRLKRTAERFSPRRRGDAQNV